MNYKKFCSERFDIVINATPSYEVIKLDNLGKGTIVYDLKYTVYNPFLEEASKYTDECVNGITMLVYQAIESYRIWFDKPGNITTMFEKAIELQLGNNNG